MAEIIGTLIGFGIYLWLSSLGSNNGKPNHKNMTDSQIDNEVDKYLK